MKKTSVRLLAVLLAMMMLLSACGSSTTSSSSSTTSSDSSTSTSTDSDVFVLNMYDGEYAITDLITYQTIANEMDDFCVQHSQLAKNSQVLTNLVSGLCAMDTDGQLIPAIASSWESNEDCTVWTFYLRDDVVWVDYTGEVKASLTAEDFIAGLEWVLNAAKNEATNTSMPIEMIQGAEEYYTWTAELDEEEAAALAYNNETFLEMVGIEAIDDYTLQYTCLSSKPYFDTISTYVCLFPVAPALLDELGVEGYRGCSYDTMWYCGPYILTEYIQGNEKVLEANESWFGNDEHTRFQTVTVKMIDDADVAFTLYQSGDLDHVTLSESALATITEGSEYYDYLVEALPTKYAYQFYLCYEKYNEDGTLDEDWNKAAANEAFRKALYYGLDLTNWYKRINATNPLKCENNCLTMTNLCFTSDGTDYTTLVKNLMGIADYNGETMVRYDEDLGQSYKEQAMEELSALGVSFPIEIDYYISASSQTALDSANVLKDCISQTLGDDFVVLNICTYVSSITKEVRDPQLASIYSSGWGADYGDPINFLSQFTIGDDNAYYSVSYTKINNIVESGEDWAQDLISIYETYTAMVKEADTIVDDLDARYEAMAECEAYFLEHCLTIPTYYAIEWELTNINDYSKVYSVYGSVGNYYYVDWETNYNGYTTADYEAFAAE